MLDNQTIKICEYECEALEEERVLYFPGYDKIAVLNGTASFIWNIIVENAPKGVSSTYIANAICEKYQLLDMDIHTILCDVDDFLSILIQEKLIIVNGIS